MDEQTRYEMREIKKIAEWILYIVVMLAIFVFGTAIHYQLKHGWPPF